mgnify:CR=1 FL=1
MKPYLASMLAIAFFVPCISQAQDEPMKGLWARGDGKAVVRIDNCGSDLCAVNTWIKPGTKGEKAGDKLVMSVKPSGGGVYEGQASDPQRNLTYKLKITTGSNSMTTRGCVLAGIVCKSVSWSRTTSETQ